MKKLLLVIGAILAFSVLGYAETSTGDIGRYQLYSCNQTAISGGVTVQYAEVFRIDTKTGKTERNIYGTDSEGKVQDFWKPIE